MSGSLSPDQRPCSCNSQHSFVVPPGTYFIKNVMTGTLIDLRSSGREEGTVIQSWSYVGGNNQKWKLESSGYGQSVILRSVHANSYIWVPYQLHAQEILTKASFTAQQWVISNADRGFYISPVQYPEYVLDLFYGSSANSAKIGLWKNLQADNQKWYFVPA
ncbi:unnamed protein product [Rhizoctonia solani]|uniref:Ricin B lectin domain-containing protein n=1 Tax=Rhizoctonia solani TaxID=456999 RepID=A0A8H3GHC9_9AGAM|nr:unnamed protein product [Rhizoctonia solani]